LARDYLVGGFGAVELGNRALANIVPQAITKIALLTTDQLVSDALGFSPAKLPTSAINYRAVAIPFVDLIAGTPNIDTVVSTPSFAVAAVSPPGDRGVSMPDNGTVNVNAATTSKFNISTSASFMFLHCFYSLQAPPSTRGVIGKSVALGSANPGFNLRSIGTNTVWEMATGALLQQLTQADITIGLWAVLAGRDVAANQAKMFSNIDAQQTPTLTATGTLSNAAPFRVGSNAVNGSLNAVHLFTAFWTGTPAEGHAQANLDAFVSYITT
jgi:hypothetical protein